MSQSTGPEVSPATLEVVPLGGLGEFGMNMMAVSWEETTILIDAGVMFPEPDQLGVDLIIPDLTYLESRRANIKALVLTHGHEDHIGAVPYLLRRRSDLPVFGSRLTLALVREKLREHRLRDVDLRVVGEGDRVTVGSTELVFGRSTP